MMPVRRAGWVWAASGAPAAKKLRGLSVRAQARRISISLSFSVAFFLFFPRFCLLRAARRGAARGSAIQGPGKGGALSLVLIVQATAEEVHRVIANRDLNCFLGDQKKQEEWGLVPDGARVLLVEAESKLMELKYRGARAGGDRKRACGRRAPRPRGGARQ